MKAIDSLRKEFFSLLRDTGLVDGYSDTYNAWSLDEQLIRAVICNGLYPGVCSVVVCLCVYLILINLCFFPLTPGSKQINPFIVYAFHCRGEVSRFHKILKTKKLPCDKSSFDWPNDML